MSAALMQAPAAQQAIELSAVARSTTRIKLTRRGRVVMGVLATSAVAALLALMAALFAPQAVASDAAGEASFGYVVAGPGASLWQLATELDPAMDPRDLVAEIVQLNQLRGVDIVVGQPVAVPLRYNESPSVVTSEELGI